jgi:hypothetical protein
VHVPAVHGNAWYPSDWFIEKPSDSVSQHGTKYKQVKYYSACSNIMEQYLLGLQVFASDYLGLV